MSSKRPLLLAPRRKRTGPRAAERKALSVKLVESKQLAVHAPKPTAAKRVYKKKKPTAADRAARWRYTTVPMTAEMRAAIAHAREQKYGPDRPYLSTTRPWTRAESLQAITNEMSRMERMPYRHFPHELTEEIGRALNRDPPAAHRMPMGPLQAQILLRQEESRQRDLPRRRQSNELLEEINRSIYGYRPHRRER